VTVITLPRVTDRTVGAKVRRLRTDRGWSQPELARRFHCHPHVIANIEHGRRGLKLIEALELSLIFQTSLDEIVH
jgi:transcriptional regulator with XRE-family HTH domain